MRPGPDSAARARAAAAVVRPGADSAARALRPGALSRAVLAPGTGARPGPGTAAGPVAAVRAEGAAAVGFGLVAALAAREVNGG